jgi:hypothetical protein
MFFLPPLLLLLLVLLRTHQLPSVSLDLLSQWPETLSWHLLLLLYQLKVWSSLHGALVL